MTLLIRALLAIEKRAVMRGWLKNLFVGQSVIAGARALSLLSLSPLSLSPLSLSHTPHTHTHTHTHTHIYIYIYI